MNRIVRVSPCVKGCLGGHDGTVILVFALMRSTASGTACSLSLRGLAVQLQDEQRVLAGDDDGLLPDARDWPFHVYVPA